MSKKLEKLADEMMRLTPQEGEQLALIINYANGRKEKIPIH